MFADSICLQGHRCLMRNTAFFTISFLCVYNCTSLWPFCLNMRKLWLYLCYLFCETLWFIISIVLIGQYVYQVKKMPVWCVGEKNRLSIRGRWLKYFARSSTPVSFRLGVLQAYDMKEGTGVTVVFLCRAIHISLWKLMYTTSDLFMCSQHLLTSYLCFHLHLSVCLTQKLDDRLMELGRLSRDFRIDPDQILDSGFVNIVRFGKNKQVWFFFHQQKRSKGLGVMHPRS